MSQLNAIKNESVLSRRQMLSATAFGGICGFAGNVLFANSVFAQSSAVQPVTALAQSSHSTLKLVSGGAVEGQAGLYHVGLVMELKPGFKTYWRSPGDSGVPPQFNFDNSQNLAAAEVQFPAPKRFPDGAGGHSFGYSGPQVILPVLVRAKDPSKPVRLHLKADYAVCETICIPSGGEISLTVSGKAEAESASLVAEARRRVPVQQKLRQGEALTILALEKADMPEHFHVMVSMKGSSAQDASVPELFVEGETPWFFDVKSMTRQPAVKDGHAMAVFLVAVIERSKAVDCTGAEITLTLVSGQQSIEVATRLNLAIVTH